MLPNCPHGPQHANCYCCLLNPSRAGTTSIQGLSVRRMTADPMTQMGAVGAVPFALAALFLAGAASAEDGSSLPKGRAGECYQQHRIHAVYRLERQEIPQAPVVTTRTFPAVTEQRLERVVDVRAHVVWVDVPAQYATVPKIIQTVGPPRWVRMKAVYRTISERVLTAPAHLEWRRTTSAAGFGGEGAPGDAVVRATGEVICRVLVPARYGWTRRRILVSPAGVTQAPGLSHKIVCYVKVLAAPAHKVAHTVPATYKTLCKTVVIKPARTETITTPRPPKVRIIRVRVTAGKTVWSKIDCRGTAAPARAGAAKGPERASTERP